MKRIEVHKYRTPTRNNPDCEWSLGIMNLTKAEARMIATFANSVRDLPRPTGTTLLTFRCRNGHPLMWPDDLCYVCEGRLVIVDKVEPTNGNRFSGLDLETNK